jgi:carbon storage regulator
MLVIRRHPGEAIQIGEDVEILVIDCGCGRVKLGIRAPQHIAVMRGEVRTTREQNLAAARTLTTGAYFGHPVDFHGFKVQTSVKETDR